eukprot:s440_g13.t1
MLNRARVHQRLIIFSHRACQSSQVQSKPKQPLKILQIRNDLFSSLFQIRFPTLIQPRESQKPLPDVHHFATAIFPMSCFYKSACMAMATRHLARSTKKLAGLTRPSTLTALRFKTNVVRLLTRMDESEELPRAQVPSSPTFGSIRVSDAVQ